MKKSILILLFALLVTILFGACNSSPQETSELTLIEIPPALFRPDEGADNLDPSMGYLEQVGDWLIYRSGIQSILPVPLGWSTIETGNKTHVFFSKTADQEAPDCLVTLAWAFSAEDGGPETSAEILAELEASGAGESGLEILKINVINDQRGYAIFRVTTEDGEVNHILQYFSRYANNPSGDFFHIFTAITLEQDWEIYAPIIQAMLENWSSLDGHLLGSAITELRNLQ